MLVVPSVVASVVGGGTSVESTGAWKLHNGSTIHYKLDNPLVARFATLLHKKTVVDLGAGQGNYVHALRQRGIEAVGLEGVVGIESIAITPHVRHADLTRPLVPCVQYDWALCLEVAEHIPRHLEAQFLANLACSARYGLVLSWGRPGQGGHGHVNERDALYVQQTVEALGFTLDAEWSARLQRAATLSWFRTNVHVFRSPRGWRKLAAAARASTSALPAGSPPSLHAAVRPAARQVGGASPAGGSPVGGQCSEPPRDIYECLIIGSSELRLLQLHLDATAHLVSAWSIVEARTTHQGTPRPLADAFFASAAVRKYGSRVRRQVVDLPCNSTRQCSPMTVQMQQRSHCLASLKASAAPPREHDVLLVLDPDEIPSPAQLHAIRTSACQAVDVVHLRMWRLYYDLGCLSARSPELHGGGAKAGATFRYLHRWLATAATSPDGGRARHWAHEVRMASWLPGAKVLTPNDTAGYHLSFFQNASEISGKLTSFGERTSLEWAGLRLVSARISGGCPAKNRHGGLMQLLIEQRGMGVCSHGGVARSDKHRWIQELVAHHLPEVWGQGLGRDPSTGQVGTALHAGGWGAPLRVALPSTGPSGSLCGRPQECSRSGMWWRPQCVWQRVRDWSRLFGRCEDAWGLSNGTTATCVRLALAHQGPSVGTTWLRRKI